jgi:hypothetical protein
MAGSTSRKSDKPETEKVDDAPKLENVPPEEEFATNPPADSDVVDAQTRPMDQQENPSTEAAKDSVPEVFVTVNIPNVPVAATVKEGQPDPSLVTIPGLGQFRNGTKTAIDATQLLLFQQHYAATNIGSARLPAGVTIEEGE